MGCYIWFGTAMRGMGGLRPRPCGPLLAVPNVTVHPSTVSVKTSRCSTISTLVLHSKGLSALKLRRLSFLLPSLQRRFQMKILLCSGHRRRTGIAYERRDPLLLSLLFHARQAAIKLPSAEASKRAQCTSPGHYTPYIKGIMKTP